MSKRFAFLMVVVVLFCSGCRTTYYHQRFPELERPERPQLENISGTEMKKMSPEARGAVTGNFNSLLDYVKQLEVAIDTYNAYAVEKNAEMGFSSEDGE